MRNRYPHTISDYMPQSLPRTPTVRGEVVIPVLQGAFVGLAASGLVGVVVWVVAPTAYLQRLGSWHVVASWAVPVGAVVMCAATIWFILQQRPQRPVEQPVVADTELQQEEPEPPIRVVVYDDPTGKQQRWFDLPVSDAKMKRVAQAVLWQGKNFSRPVLSTELGILTQGEYNDLAAALRKAQMAVLMADNHHELLVPGKKLLRQFL